MTNSPACYQSTSAAGCVCVRFDVTLYSRWIPDEAIPVWLMAAHVYVCCLFSCVRKQGRMRLTMRKCHLLLRLDADHSKQPLHSCAYPEPGHADPVLTLRLQPLMQVRTYC